MSTTPAAPPPQEGRREGILEAPTRHPLEWRTEAFYDAAALEKELERVFDICHGCRRCFNLCGSFPTLFDAVDATADGEVHGVDKKVYWEVVDNCYLCDMCFMTKCPYVPPHPWNVDFPHLMLRAKAVRAKKRGHRPAREGAGRHRHGRRDCRHTGRRRDRERGESLRPGAGAPRQGARRRPGRAAACSTTRAPRARA